ncbi:MAG: T9SS type A sorting domain-containing protein [Bacteroidetes bacterium]|nr:T9SS type A sorting domain-containing protein [Bacteroidota bacterium]
MQKLFIYVFLCLFFGVKAQTYNYYFGNIHAHSGYSDGNKDSSSNGMNKPADDFAFAKLSQHFDFMGLSEHNHHSSSDLAMTPSRYQMGIQQTNAANSGTFACLYGMEYGVISSGGHIVTYGFNQLIGWEPGNYDVYNAKLDYDTYFRRIAHTPGTFAYLAHPNTGDYPVGTNGIDGSAYNATYDSAIVGVPFRSGPAFSTFTDYSDMDNSDYTPYYNKLLAKGYHLGMGYDHDTHYLTFGRHTTGRLVVLATSLSPANVMDAMLNMRFYGSDDWNTQVNFTVNSKVMGSIVKQNASPQISVSISDADGETAQSIKLYAGTPGTGINPAIMSSVSNNNTLLYTDASLTFGATRYYYLKITQPDGDVIVTSPIWYTYTDQVGIETYNDKAVWNVYPNPVNNVLNIATEFNEAYTLRLLDVSGRTVLEQTETTPGTQLDLASFSKGYYTLQLQKGQALYTKKVFVE